MQEQDISFAPVIRYPSLLSEAAQQVNVGVAPH